MKNIILILSLIGSLSIETADAQMKGDTYYLPAIDVTAEKSQAISAKDVPLKYAVGTEIKDIYHKKNNNQSGQWTQLFDGSWEYKLRLESKNATSLNVGMKDFFLPHSAELWVSTDDQSIMRGPYNDTYNKSHGFFWVGDVPADHMNIKITVNDREKDYLSFNINNVTRGFYRHWVEPSYLIKSGSCNVDVACPEAEGWEQPISSVGRYTFSLDGGGFLCTGQLINNTAFDGTPYFLTADHCGYSRNGVPRSLLVRQNIAASIALTWNYESLTCRAPGSSLSGTQISTNGFNDRQSGATFLASNPDSDFSLVLLNEIPFSNYALYYTGWDRSDTVPNSAVSIHHPAGHAKRFSIENDPLTITGSFTEFLGNEGFFRVEDWDLGTTEAGSSGGGLWNQDKLLVGQLFGGSAACGNDAADWYGRFYKSWDNGTDSQTRLKDWLDPDETEQETLESYAGCQAPVISIVNNSSNKVGDLLSFTAQVSGGAGGYSFQWDLNGDGIVESTDSIFQARFNQAFTGNLQLSVRDSAGCGVQTSDALVIEGADLQLQNMVNISENLDQLCGNNDNEVDPGERWRTLLEVKNIGSKPASSAYLALGKSREITGEGVFDNYGNSISLCNRTFIDISQTGTMYPWEAAANVTGADAEDEGSALIQLSQSFDHYGQNISQVRVSTNGFISTSADATGGDWDNDCPLPQSPDKDDEGARIAPMHDDLKDAVFYHQLFSSCPRPAEVGGDLACEVFLWQGADLFDTAQNESIDIQAILYPATSQWVYQYSGSGFDGSGSTTGMQNTAASDGLTYACDTANSINSTEAVCTYNRNHQPPSNGADFVQLESPVISLGDLLVNASQSRNMNFAISEDATCGATFGINHQASVYDEGFNAGQNNILTQTIGNNGQCNVVTSCDVGTSNEANNDIVPRRGLWWNPDRDGNGFDWYTIGTDRLVYFFYTGDASGEPVWYLANDADSNFDQYYNDITKYRVPGGFGNGVVGFDVVGWSNTTFIDDSTAIQVREIDGQFSAEKQYFFQYAANQTPNMHTGSFYTPSESGWGHSIGTLGNARVSINYIYDQTGNPYWTIGNGPNDNSEFDVYYVNTFCPSCPAVAGEYRVVGEIKMTLNGQASGTLNYYNVTDEGVSWNKTNLYIENLIPPNN